MRRGPDKPSVQERSTMPFMPPSLHGASIQTREILDGIDAFALYEICVSV